LKDLKDGYQYVEDCKINFIETLQEKSVIKLDDIVLIKHCFTEITLNYFFYYTKGNTDPNVIDVGEELYYSYRKNVQKGDYYKALKRLYQYYQINKKIKDANTIINIFNSNLGKTHKILLDLAIINKLLDNKFRKPKRKDIIENLSLLVIDANNQHLIDIHGIINKQSFSEMKQVIDHVLTKWELRINIQFKEVMKKYQL
jgi:hypothetical protein